MMRYLMVATALSLVSPAALSQEPIPAPPEEQPDSDLSERIERLIEQLGAERYFDRRRAQEELAEIGPPAFDALDQAQSHPDIEIAARAKFLVRMIPVRWIAAETDPGVREALDGYVDADDEGRIERVAKLGQLPAETALGPLCRIVRYEHSPVVAKRAAATALELTMPEDPATLAELHRQVAEELGASERPGAGWLKADVLRQQGQREKAADALIELSDAEAETLEKSPWATSPEIVAAVFRRRCEALADLGRREPLLEGARKVVELTGKDTAELAELIGWLGEVEAWEVLDEVRRDRQETIDAEFKLLYALAAVREKQGEDEAVAKLVEQARALNPGNAQQHLIAAYELREAGHLDWADAEFRITMATEPKGNRFGMLARYWLAEMLHDRLRDLDAAKVYEEAAKLMEENIKNGDEAQNMSRDVGAVRARMHYFYAEDHREAGRREEQIERLEKSLEADPLDADALIALYRLPNPGAERKETTLQQIASAAEEFRKQIRENPGEAGPYNQLAWLVGNTTGDYQEALEASKKSLEIRPNTAAYLDTLGRCYYALGDLENAVQTQRQAVRLEPHSGQMRRQLDLFEKALEESSQRDD